LSSRQSSRAKLTHYVKGNNSIEGQENSESINEDKKKSEVGLEALISRNMRLNVYIASGLGR